MPKPQETNGIPDSWDSDDNYDDNEDESDSLNSSLGEDDEKFASQLKGQYNVVFS